MWPALWRPCCSSRTAASSSRSSTACEYTPHPSPASPGKRVLVSWAGDCIYSLSLVTAMTGRPGQDCQCGARGRGTPASSSGHRVCLWERFRSRPTQRLPHACAGEPASLLAFTAFQEPALELAVLSSRESSIPSSWGLLFSHKLSWQPVGPGRRKGKLLLLREISGT